VSTIAFAEDASSLLVGMVNGTLRQWDLATGERRPGLTRVPQRLASELVSSRAGRIARIDAAANHRLELVEPTGEVRVLLEGGNSLASVRLSPDGARAAVTDVAGNVHILPLGAEGIRSSYLIPEPADPAKSSRRAAIVRFSADGQRIALGSQGGDIHLLDAATGKRIAILPGIVEIKELEFAPAGDRLVSLDTDNHARLWTLTGALSAFLLDEARRLSPRCLTPQERTQAFLEGPAPSWCKAPPKPVGINPL
jgi:WD40 repeat protein